MRKRKRQTNRSRLTAAQPCAATNLFSVAPKTWPNPQVIPACPRSTGIFTANSSIAGRVAEVGGGYTSNHVGNYHVGYGLSEKTIPFPSS